MYPKLSVKTSRKFQNHEAQPYRGANSKRDEEQIMTKQNLRMKPLTYKERQQRNLLGTVSRKCTGAKTNFTPILHIYRKDLREKKNHIVYLSDSEVDFNLCVWSEPLCQIGFSVKNQNNSFQSKLVQQFANRGDHHQTPRSAASDLGLHCLPVTRLEVSSLQ